MKLKLTFTKIATTALFVAFFSITSFAQTNFFCPSNIDFEQNNFTNWLGNVGQVQNGTPGSISTLVYQSIPTGINPIQQIVRSSGVDHYGGFPVVNPYSTNSYSLQLGDTTGFAGSVCAQVKYYVHIPVGVNKYSLEYFYAIVMENPHHPIESQPDFRMTVTDSANNNIRQCSSFIITQPINGAFPGFYLSSQTSLPFDSVYYQPWHPSTVNLDGLAGHTICIEFDASDCAFGGHWGYAYVDFSTACTSPVLTNGTCLGAPIAIVQANTGFSEYQWYDSTLTTLLDTTQTLVLNPAPTAATKLYCVLTPLNHLGCNDTVPFYLTQGLQSIANFSFVPKTCAGSSIQFYDSTIKNNPNGFINKWKWNFGDIYANANNPNTDSTQNPEHRFDSIGNYTVCLISNPNLYCLADTICKTVVINNATPILNIYSTKDSICGNFDSTTIVFTGNISSNFNYQWLLDSTSHLISGNLNLPNPIQVSFSAAGYHNIQLQQIPSKNDTNCIAIGNVNIFVKGLKPYLSIFGIDSTCINSATTIKLSKFSFPNCIAAPAIFFSATNSYNIGQNNAGNISHSTPFNGSWTESKCQMLYLASELKAMGMQKGLISELAWNVLTKNSLSPPPYGSGPCTGTDQYHDFTIKMACVPYNSLFRGSFNSDTLDLVTPLTLVYTTPTYNTTVGINNFVLQNAYNWDGVSNLLIQTCFDAGYSCYSGEDDVASSTCSSIAASVGAPLGINLTAIAHSDVYSGCSPTYGSSGIGYLENNTRYRPDIIFKTINLNFAPSTQFSWSSNPVGVSSSADSLIVTPSISTTYTLTGNDNGCISTVSHKINVVPQINIHQYQTTCHQHPILFNGNYLNQSGVYFDTLFSAFSCDTIIALHLNVDTNFVAINQYQTICQGKTFYFNGSNLTTQGIYYDTLPSLNTFSCDTLIILNLYVPTNTFTFVDTACSTTGFLFLDSTLSHSGIYTFTTHHPLQCDTVFVLYLTVLNNVQATITANASTLTCTNNGFLYQWFDCQTMQPIVGANSQNFTPTTNGNYAVGIRKDSCFDMSNCYNFIASGLNNLVDSKFKIYPNPTDDAISITWKKDLKVKEIYVTDLLGRVMLSQIPTSQSANLSLKNLDAGIYFLHLKGDQETITKVIKE